MKRILILCEGQTEEAFIKYVLLDHFIQQAKALIPVLLRTRRTPTGFNLGGVSTYPKIRSDVLNLLGDRNACCVTTFLDYYGLPNDFPGKSGRISQASQPSVQELEEAFRRDIGDERFLPFLMLHEFEALLFVDLKVVYSLVQPGTRIRPFSDLDRFSTPEEINNGDDTHPSARLQRVLPRYQKALHGPLAAQRIGLNRMRSSCPHFNEWLTKIEQL